MISLVLFAAAIPLAFAGERLALALYVLVAMLRFLPARRTQRMLLG